MTKWFSAGLCALEFRRAFWRVLSPTGLLLGLVLALRTAQVSSLPFENAASARGLHREETWVAFLLILIPLSVFRAARIPTLWRSGEADWLGARPIERSAAIVSTWAGLALALLLTVVGAGLWIESEIEGEHESPVFVGALALPDPLPLNPGATRSIAIAGPALADLIDTQPGPAIALRARVRLTILPGGDPTSQVRLTVAGAPGSTEVLVDGRTWLEVDCRLSGESLDFELSNMGAGHVVCLATPGIELWQPGGRERQAWVSLATRACLGLGWATALAFAFATWIGSFTAASTVLALWLALLISPGLPAWLSAASLPRALAFVAEGRLPENLDGRALLAAGAVAAAAWALAQAGLRSWRHTP